MIMMLITAMMAIMVRVMPQDCNILIDDVEDNAKTDDDK